MSIFQYSYINYKHRDTIKYVDNVVIIVVVLQQEEPEHMLKPSKNLEKYGSKNLFSK